MTDTATPAHPILRVRTADFGYAGQPAVAAVAAVAAESAGTDYFTVMRKPGHARRRTEL